MNELVILSQCAVAAVLLLASVNVNGLETAQGEMCGMNQCMMHHRSRSTFLSPELQSPWSMCK